MASLEALNQTIIECRACPRLCDWREAVARAKRKSFSDQTYWGRPVPNFGDPTARGLIVGLAPAAHGANRTGRMFTGDRSGDWLFRALHRAGAANQATSAHCQDGLELKNVLITAAVHCAPPDNKPTPPEILACRPYLRQLLDTGQFTTFLCLGGIAWVELHRALGQKPVTPFAHGAQSGPILASYHPSQQNTFTGRLTESMLDEVVQKFVRRLSESPLV